MKQYSLYNWQNWSYTIAVIVPGNTLKNQSYFIVLNELGKKIKYEALQRLLLLSYKIHAVARLQDPVYPMI